jgi:hypothetical protein
MQVGDASIDLVFPAAVEQWRSLVQKYAGATPIPFLLAWIQKESGGNPCSYTSLRESGVFQLMPPDNLTQGGTTEAALRAACIGSSQSPARALTNDEAEEQIRSGMQYVDYARSYARALVNWPESGTDFWKLVKMVHVAPARVSQYAPGTSSWAEFRKAAAPTTPASWLDNAEWVGSYGVGGGGSTTAILVLAAISIVGAMLYLRNRSR